MNWHNELAHGALGAGYTKPRRVSQDLAGQRITSSRSVAYQR